MRGTPEPQLSTLSTELIPRDHPIRRIRKIVDVVLDGERIEEPLGWIKTHRRWSQAPLHRPARNRAWFLMTGAIYNLIRIAALDTAPT